MSTESERLEFCEVCASNKAKYTCPKCEVRTCGLKCVNIHKTELKCDGIRDKTKYIPLQNFTDLDLLSDYRLLEDIGKSVDILRRNPAKRYTRQRDTLPVHLQKLKYFTQKRNINIEFMPQNFTRHKENTTFLNWKTDELFWRVELIFLQAENIKWVIERVPENKRLYCVMEEVFYPNSFTSDSDGNDLSNKISTFQNKIQFYKARGLTGIKVLLKAERIQNSCSRYHELDLAESLKENLKNKTVIEFPTLFVILADHTNTYDILSSDEEDQKIQYLENRTKRKQFERKKSILNDKFTKRKEQSKEPINYFFNSADTDSEDGGDESNLKSSNTNDRRNFHIPAYDDLVKMEF